MRNVARLIERIEDEMSTEKSDVTAVNMEHFRMAEALLFAAEEPLDEKALASQLPDGADVPGLLKELQAQYEKHGVNLFCVAEKWQFRTASDLSFLLRKEKPEQKRL